MLFRTACGKRVGLALVIFIFGHLTAAAASSLEEVYVNRIGATDDRAIIMRASGETYLIEKGSGCYSLWRYRGTLVVVASPGPFFLGLGSKLLLPETNQRCNIWNVARRLNHGEKWSPVELELD